MWDIYTAAGARGKKGAEIILDEYARMDKKKNPKQHLKERERRDYPVGGLLPLLFGRHHGPGGDGPAPEHFVVMDGNVGLLRQGPVETGRQRAVLARRHAGDVQIAGPGRGCGICGGGGEEDRKSLNGGTVCRLG